MAQTMLKSRINSVQCDNNNYPLQTMSKFKKKKIQTGVTFLTTLVKVNEDI